MCDADGSSNVQARMHIPCAYTDGLHIRTVNERRMYVPHRVPHGDGTRVVDDVGAIKPQSRSDLPAAARGARRYFM